MSKPEEQNTVPDPNADVVSADDPKAASTETAPQPNETIEAEELEFLDPVIDAGVDPVGVALANELDKWKDLASRSQADLENYRKRMAREKMEAIQYANTSLLNSLLPVIDNFEMGLTAAANENPNSVIFQGMSMVQKQLVDFLAENRVELVEAPEGTNFDPNIHEALKQEHSETVPEGQVISVLRKGYRLKERLLRPANVVVSQGPAIQENNDDSAVATDNQEG